jgi:hypothetical protein
MRKARREETQQLTIRASGAERARLDDQILKYGSSQSPEVRRLIPDAEREKAVQG